MTSISPGMAQAEDNIRGLVLTLADPTDSAGVFIEKVQHAGDEIVDRATYDGSLVASQMARDLQILLGDARQYMHEELTYSLNDLGDKELGLLAAMDSIVKAAQETADKGMLLLIAEGARQTVPSVEHDGDNKNVTICAETPGDKGEAIDIYSNYDSLHGAYGSFLSNATKPAP